MATIFVQDTFTGANGTLLTARVGETGATWTGNPTYPSQHTIQLNRVYPPQPATNVSMASGIPQGADYQVEGVVYANEFPGNLSRIGVAARIDPATGECYFATYYNGAWRLYRLRTGGFLTSLGSFTTTLTVGQSYTVTLVVQGSAQTVLVNGIQRVAAADTVLALAGRVGIASFNNSGTGTDIHLDSITATNIETEPPPDVGVINSVTAVANPASVEQGQGTTVTATIAGTAGDGTNRNVTVTTGTTATGLTYQAGVFPKVIPIDAEMDANGDYSVGFTFGVDVAVNAPIGVRSFTLVADETTATSTASGSGSITVTEYVPPPPPPPDPVMPEITAGILLRRPDPMHFTTKPRFWKSDMYRRKLEPIDPALVTNGEVSWKQSANYGREVRFEVVNPESLTIPGGFVAPELIITDEYGNQEVYPLGHYTIDEPSVEDDDRTITAGFKGYDITYLLDRSDMPDGLTVSAPIDVSIHAANVGLLYGMPPDMIAIPLSGVELSAEKRFDPGTTYLEAINAFMEMGGMYPVWTTMLGKLTSEKVRNITEVAPVTTYSNYNGAAIVPPVRFTPDFSRMRNRVTVRKITPGKPTLHATSEIQDRSSPIHPERLGERYNNGKPMYLSEVIDLPNIDDSFSGQIIMHLTAIHELSQRAAYHQTVDIQTFVDIALDPYQVVALDIKHGSTHYYMGSWLQRGWTLPMKDPQSIVRREMFRVESVL